MQRLNGAAIKLRNNPGSATTGEETRRTNQSPHGNHRTRTATIIDALKRRAESVLNDPTIDAQSRAVIRYALQTNDPWLAKLVRRGDAREPIVSDSGTIVDVNDLSETPSADEDDPSQDKIEALAEIICREGDGAGTRSAALLVLMATLENATHPKELANLAKHVAFTRCGELNFNGMVDDQIAALERELFAAESV